mmetsp:Transcript_129603/g.336195  ORF Transcript_129603/g.336195 Transcript_129603/m.336195 type:complete len:332 (-) Transcript_129603:177-1172(-)
MRRAAGGLKVAKQSEVCRYWPVVLVLICAQQQDLGQGVVHLTQRDLIHHMEGNLVRCRVPHLRVASVVEEPPEGAHDLRHELDARGRQLHVRLVEGGADLSDQPLRRRGGGRRHQALVAVEVQKVQRHQLLRVLALHDGSHEVADRAQGEQVLRQGNEGKLRGRCDQLTEIRARVHRQQILRQVQGVKRDAVAEGLHQGGEGLVIDGRVPKEGLLEVALPHPLVDNTHQLGRDLCPVFPCSMIVISRAALVFAAARCRRGLRQSGDLAHAQVLNLPLQHLRLRMRLVASCYFLVELARQADHTPLHGVKLGRFLLRCLRMGVRSCPLVGNL